MDQSATPPPSKSFVITIADASDFPMIHVNAMNVRFAADEFFVTLGSVIPPEFHSEAEFEETGAVIAQPVFRFAVSRQVMTQFINLLSTQFNNQTALLQQIVGRAQEAQQQTEAEHE